LFSFENETGAAVSEAQVPLALGTVTSFWLPAGATASRSGANPLGFGDLIVLLTAVHFHYAGFAAPILVGLTGRRLTTSSRSARRIFRLAAIGVIAGVPLVALGITFSRALEIGAALLLATSLLTLAALVVVVVVPRVRQRPAQILPTISAAASVVTILLAAAYAAGGLAGLRITIPQMVLAHGVVNAFGLVLCGLVGWTIAAE
jgi:hypothetical protein